MTGIAILGAARTPIGGLQGQLAPLSAAQLGGIAIAAALDRSGVPPGRVAELLMGCVLPAGQGQAPARQAGFLGGLSEGTPATTLNKMCGSGLQAVRLACDALAARGGYIVAGGMESMSNAPYLLPQMRGGARLGHGRAVDHMFLDGLEDAYEPGRLMGSYAEDCATAFQFSRAAQDEYARRSLSLALAAETAGLFNAEIAAVTVAARQGPYIVTADEQPQKARPDKIASLKPAFREGGTVTAANASSISDGAAALVLARAGDARGLRIRAHIRGHAGHAQAPGQFPTAPIPAIEALLATLGWGIGDVDLWEINEAFAVVPMAAEARLGIARERINIHGGACALGHPIGASGARILVTLLHALEARELARGVAAICIGGGEALAMAIERP